MIAESVHRFFERHRIGPGRIVVACSGGADSTALLVVLSEMGRWELLCAHVNHRLRGAESDGDEEFVRALCAKMGVPLVVIDGSIGSEAVRRAGLESAARDVRIERLQEIRGGAGFIATAHQKNDQAETIVMRLLTGTGLAGMRGIHEVRDDGFIRPLIDVTRAEIDRFLAARGITPRSDSLNADPRFLRNRVRAALHDVGPAAIDDIAAVAAQAQDLWPRVERAIDAAERQHVSVTDGEARFASWPDDPWMRRALLQRHIHRLDAHARDVSAKDLERLETSLATIRRVSVTKTLELVRRNGALVLRRLPQPAEPFELTIRAGESTTIPQIDARITISPAPRQPGDPATRQPAAATRFTVRNRRPGDRFAHKKLKDLLIDRKIAVEARDRLPLLVCNGEIIWVGGLEAGERFNVTGPAGELIEVVLEHASQEDQVEVRCGEDRQAR